MEFERTKNTMRNIVYKTILKVYQLIVPFIIRTLMIYYIGIEYVGLNGLFVSLLVMLNLVELGVGSAMTFSLYKPIAEDDKTRINALLNMYRRYYIIIGIVILTVGMILLPVVPYMVSGDIPEGMNLYVLYLVNLGSSVVSYWLFSYRWALLLTHQRDDIYSKINLVTTTVKYILQMYVIVVERNYYLFLVINLGIQIVTNLITAAYTKIIYPDYKPEGHLPKEEVKEINGRIKDLFISKIGGTIIYSADAIVISVFFNMTTLGIYNNYNYIFSSITGFVGIVFYSSLASVGNSIVVESKAKNHRDLQKFTFITGWIATFCSSCLLALYQPFMKIWVGETLMLDMYVVISFAACFFVVQLESLLSLYKEAAGIWRQDRFRPFFTAILNLALNITLVHFIGLVGVILSTFISISILSLPWLLRNLFKYVLETDSKQFTKKLLVYTGVAFVTAVITYRISLLIPDGGIWWFVLKVVVSGIIPNIIFVLVFMRSWEFKEVMRMLSDYIPIKSFKRYFGEG